MLRRWHGGTRISARTHFCTNPFFAAWSYSKTMTWPFESNERGWGRPPNDPGIELNMSALLLDTHEVQVRVDRVTVHAGGIMLHLSGHGKGTWPGREAARGRKERIDVSVTFADGRSARLNDSAGLKSGLGPMVTWVGGTWMGRSPEDDEEFDQVLWIWPLPPPGPMTLAVSWPDMGLTDSNVTIDGEDARRLSVPLLNALEVESLNDAEPSDPVSLDDELVVPDVVGMEVHAARSLARDIGLFLEYSDADGPPLASGVIIRQHPVAGEFVRRFTPVKAWVRNAMDDPGFGTRPDEPGGDGRPPGGVREPRRPLPGSDDSNNELLERELPDH